MAQLRASAVPPGRSSSTGLPDAPAPATPALPQAWLTIRVPQGQQVYRIEKPVINIGRQLQNDIIVEDKRVSRHHAQIKYQADGQFTIFDLSSTNGISINNQPGVRQHVLHNGDHFTIGSYDFVFQRR
jgi:pSer/pThr/pTyr-binding forkhead associated (FHA) protein